jgi:hypothetical protein
MVWAAILDGRLEPYIQADTSARKTFQATFHLKHKVSLHGPMAGAWSKSGSSLGRKESFLPRSSGLLAAEVSLKSPRAYPWRRRSTAHGTEPQLLWSSWFLRHRDCSIRMGSHLSHDGLTSATKLPLFCHVAPAVTLCLISMAQCPLIH